MTDQAGLGCRDQPVPHGRGVPAGEPSAESSGLHFAAPGFAEPPALPAFAVMPETMPPPPVRPVLPPDKPAEPHKPGLIARLLGGAKQAGM